MGWMKDIGNIYDNEPITESWKNATPAGDKLSYRNNKMGMGVSNMAADSLAGNVQFGNPYEQEEVLVDGSMDKQELLGEIDKLLSGLSDSSPTDRVAVMVLSQLKKKIYNI